MRVLIVGASGAIGTRLVPQLVDRGHEVLGSSRSRERAERLRELGAEPVVLDVLDARAVREAVATVRPEAIVYQATALSDLSDFKHFDRSFAPTNRLRTEGTEHLLAAAREAGVPRFVAQGYANRMYARTGGPVKSEDDPFDPTPVPGDARDGRRDALSGRDGHGCGRDRAALGEFLRQSRRRARSRRART